MNGFCRGMIFFTGRARQESENTHLFWLFFSRLYSFHKFTMGCIIFTYTLCISFALAIKLLIIIFMILFIIYLKIAFGQR